MLKRTLLVLLVCMAVGGFAVNGISANQGEVTPSNYTIARICVWPHKLYWPKGIAVHGLSFGVPATCGQGEKVIGADIALLFCKTEDVTGAQISFVNLGSKIKGAQVSLVNLSKDVKGAQVGLFNRTEDANGAQIGLVNYSKHAKSGIQLGLINVMENGFLPVFPFFNFPAK